MYALLFPTSYVKNTLRDTLSPLGIKFAVLMPTEKSPVIQETRETELSQRHTDEIKRIHPAPLGSKLKAFEGIIKSYLTWAQHIDLGRSMHAEELGRFQVDDPESVQALIKSIKTETKGDYRIDAQIFLELALIFDIQHDSLEQDLAYIRKRESLVHMLMDGSTSDDSHGPGALQFMRLPPLSQPVRRLAKWSELFLQLRQLDFFDVFFGEGREIRDIMDERYEKASEGNIPIEVLKFFLDPSVEIHPHIKSGIKDFFQDLILELNQAKEISDESLVLAGEFEQKWRSIQPKETPLMVKVVFYKGVRIVDLITNGKSKDSTHKAISNSSLALFIQ